MRRNALIIGLGSMVLLGFALGTFNNKNSQSPEAQESQTPSPTSQKNDAELAPREEQVPNELATITFVVDGDTVEIETKERVRLVGIDSPERGDPYYAEARSKLEELVLGKQVRMEKDVSERDRYGRLLRYLYLGGLFVNLEMVKQGYASAYTYPPDVKYSEQFLATEQQARDRKVGLWTSTAPPVVQPSPQIFPQPSLQPSPQTAPPSFSVPACIQSDCDCAHFSTHAYAQWFYENYDPSNRHRLDGDKDGLACESLP